MTKTQMVIDEMHRGNTNVIVASIFDQTPIVVLNAIMAGTKIGIRESAFVDGIKSAEKSDAVLLGVPLSKLATAALHLLGEREYTGDDSAVIAMINSKFAF